MGPYQCDHAGCTAEGVVYGQCIDDAPVSWLESILENDRDTLDDEQAVQVRERLDLEGSA